MILGWNIGKQNESWLAAGGWWKESLNNDGQQFHQYQQDEQSPLIITHLTQKEITTYDVGNLCPGLGQSQKMWQG